MQLIAEGRLAEAYRVARSPNPIASICGRACGAPCEDACRRGKIDAPVTIRALKRFLTEHFGPEALHPREFSEMIAARGGGSVTPASYRLPGARPDGGRRCVKSRSRRGPGRARMRERSGADGVQRDGVRSDAARRRHDALRNPRVPSGARSYRRQAAEIEEIGVEFRYTTPLSRIRSARTKARATKRSY